MTMKITKKEDDNDDDKGDSYDDKKYFVCRGQRLRSKERHVRCLDDHSRLGTACPHPIQDVDDQEGNSVDDDGDDCHDSLYEYD